MKTPEQRDRERAYHREWRRRNPERLAAYSRRRDPAKLAAYNHARYLRDRDAVIARVREWTVRNPDKKWAQDLKSYGLTVEDWNALFEEQAGVCAICERPETAAQLSPRCRGER